MKTIFTFLLLCFSISLGIAQSWMTNLEVAERLALVQNKFLVVVWENSYFKRTPVFINNSGRKVLIENMYAEPLIDSLIWANFVPVILSEDEYPKLYNKIKNTRSVVYLDKFSDDSLKVMDANGNILNLNNEDYILNLSEFINNYGLDLSFLKRELVNYKQEKNFYSAFYLASKYMDYGFFVKDGVRSEIVDLALIYSNEASVFLKDDSLDNKPALKQRIELLEIQKYLLLGRPKKVIRQLNRIDEAEIAKVNLNLRSFLYFSSYRMLQDEQNASKWRSQISGLDIKKIMSLLNKTSH